jgi:hypothetical protein
MLDRKLPPIPPTRHQQGKMRMDDDLHRSQPRKANRLRRRAQNQPTTIVPSKCYQDTLLARHAIEDFMEPKWNPKP